MPGSARRTPGLGDSNRRLVNWRALGNRPDGDRVPRGRQRASHPPVPPGAAGPFLAQEQDWSRPALL